jgi:hypothetical protein
MVITIYESVRISIIKEIKRQLRGLGTGIGRAVEYTRNVIYKGLPRLEFLVD